jgi:hypothetical protein
MLAYHNDPTLKAELLQLAAEHRAADRLIKGTYWNDHGGCAVGCTLESARRLREPQTSAGEFGHGNHALYETYLGVPEVIARLEDSIFEGLPDDLAQAWPERFLAAIRPGADLSMVWPRFLHDLLSDPTGGVQVRAAKRTDTQTAVAAVIDLYGRWVEGTKPSRDEWRAAADAANAAANAAAYAAADAANAAADAASAAASAAVYAAAAAYAAAYAAADAARSRERIRQADALIRLLEMA